MPATSTPDLSGLTRQFRALSDETRLKVIDLLRGGERCVCELTDALAAGQSLLSFHLKTLKDSGLIGPPRGTVGVLLAQPGRVSSSSRGSWVGCPRPSFRS